jgi:hypothetical protein
MLVIAMDIHDSLIEREKTGPAEPTLDAFIPDLKTLITTLQTHVTGRDLADAARESRIARAEAADVVTDTWFRHLEAFVHIEATRRAGTNVGAAHGLYNAAFPDGLAHVNDRIVDQNLHYRTTLNVLKAPEHAATITAIELPASWLATFEAALDESDAAIADVIKARGEKSTHVDLGRSAETEWVDLMVRLRKYIESRAKRTDVVRIAEGKILIKPLLDALQKLRTDAAARATRRTKKGAGAPDDATAPDAPTAPQSP